MASNSNFPEQNNKIQKDFALLDLEPDATKDQIIQRTQELVSKYAANLGEEEIATLADICIASKRLLQDNAMMNSDAEQSQNTDSFFKMVPEKPKRMKKFVKLSLMLLTSLIIILAAAIPIRNHKKAEYAETYDKLKYKMMNLNSNMDLDDIFQYLNKLPSDYKDTNTIRSEYNDIKNEINVIENHRVEVNRYYDEMREAYYNLLELDKKLESWDLSSYFDRVDRRILLLGIRWTLKSNENGVGEGEIYYFELKPNGTLSTNLPSDREDYTTYNYYADNNYTIFGFSKKYNDHDRFDAYKIIRITENELEIYCFSNYETYILYNSNNKQN